MKSVLEFNLPEEREEFELAVNAGKYASALWEIQQELRTIWKYEELEDNVYEMVDRIYTMVYDKINENNIEV